MKYYYDPLDSRVRSYRKPSYIRITNLLHNIIIDEARQLDIKDIEYHNHGDGEYLKICIQRNLYSSVVIRFHQNDIHVSREDGMLIDIIQYAEYISLKNLFAKFGICNTTTKYTQDKSPLTQKTNQSTT